MTRRRERLAASGDPVERVCVVGAGSSGIAACQVLHTRGIPFDCFEAGSEVGGNWRFGNDNGMSSAYRSLHAKSSPKGMQYAAFPMPDHYPNDLSHTLIAMYLDTFVDHFRFRDRIRFRTRVLRAESAREGGWEVTVQHRETGRPWTGWYSAVLVANGHHWDPQYPQPALPAADGFAGEQMHSHEYREPGPFAGRRILVLGIGNSACDIAAECSQLAARTLLSMRRGAHIMPKRLFGMPIDRLTRTRLGAWAPRHIQRLMLMLLLRIAQGSPTARGLPKPDHRLLSAPPAVSDSLLGKVDRGEIVVKPAVDRFDRERVHFADGSSEQVDAVIYCTGYKISFPFLDETGLRSDDGRLNLYLRIVPPNLPGLYFIGLVQPIGAIMPVAEAQALWVADLIQGRARLPAHTQMDREIAKHRALAARRFSGCSDHDIRVDFLAYLREIRKARRATAVRGSGRRGVAVGRAAQETDRRATR